jgi:hypothetical protein
MFFILLCTRRFRSRSIAFLQPAASGVPKPFCPAAKRDFALSALRFVFLLSARDKRAALKQEIPFQSRALFGEDRFVSQMCFFPFCFKAHRRLKICEHGEDGFESAEHNDGGGFSPESSHMFRNRQKRKGCAGWVA